MKNKLIFLIIIFIAVANVIKSQDLHKFVPIKFLDYTPKWFYYVEDSTAIGENTFDKFDYISQFVHINSIVRENYLYSLYRTRLKCSVDGLYVEKREISSGQKVWSYLHDLRDGGNNEKPSHMTFNDNGNLEIVGFITLDRTVFKRFPSKSFLLTLRILNSMTGKIIDSSFVDMQDSTAMILSKSYPIYKLNSSTNIDSLTFQYIQGYNNKKTDYYNRNIHAYTLDSKGHLHDTKETSFDSIMPIMYHEPPTLLEDNTFISTLHAFNGYNSLDSTYKYRYFINKFDRDLNLLNSAEITGILKFKNRYRLTQRYVDNEIIAFDYRNEPELFNWKNYYYIFDYYGNIIDSINTRPDNSDDFFAGTIQRISQDEFLIAGSNLAAADKDFTLNFYKKKIGEPLKLVKNIKLGPQYYLAVIEKIIKLENGDYLLFGTSGAKKYNSAFNQWPFWMYISGKDLEGGVGVDDIKDDEISFEIYPNPASDRLNIKFRNLFTGKIEIFDEMGNIAIGKSVTKGEKVDLEISFIPKGFYFVRAIAKDQIYKPVRFVKD